MDKILSSNDEKEKTKGGNGMKPKPTPEQHTMVIALVYCIYIFYSIDRG